MIRVMRIGKGGKRYWVTIPGEYDPGFLDSAGSGSVPIAPQYFPIISPQPKAQTTASSGAVVSFTSSAAPSGNQYFMVFQWLKNGVPLTDGGTITGSHTQFLTINSASAASAGSYTLTAYNQFGVVTSSIAGLKVV